MITSAAFRGKRYAVLGLARSGAATVRALLASGASVVAWDSDEAKRNPLLLPGGEKAGMRGSDGAAVASDIEAGSPSPNPLPMGEGLSFADLLEIDLTGFDGIVVSPGVPLNRHPIAAHARAAGVPIIGDIELFALARPSLPPHKVVGITGTNGKSTTTALIHHILKAASLPSLMGGNIGLPILSQEPLPAGGVYVLELSSYQIDLTYSLDCDVAVLTNITPDHLDRYDGFEAYAASKARLFAMQSPTATAVIVGEDDFSQRLCQRSRDEHSHGLPDNVSRWLNIATNPYDFWGPFTDGKTGPREHLSVQRDWPSLQGPHNAQNAQAAALAAEALCIGQEVISESLKTFRGLPHRMERVTERGGVLFVNDSKATNATATAPALAAYPHIRWILGGLAKSDELDDCAPHFGHVRAGYTIGEAGPLFARLLREAGKPVTESGTLAQAVRDAANDAQPGEVVMLSPACASFDQFKDYEARGDAFRAAVGAL